MVIADMTLGYTVQNLILWLAISMRMSYPVMPVQYA